MQRLRQRTLIPPILIRQWDTCYKTPHAACGFGELMPDNEKLSYDDFKRIKYDLKYPNPLSLANMGNFEQILQLDAQTYPDIADVIAVLKRWNRSTDAENRQAAIITLVYSVFNGNAGKTRHNRLL